MKTEKVIKCFQFCRQIQKRKTEKCASDVNVKAPIGALTILVNGWVKTRLECFETNRRGSGDSSSETLPISESREMGIVGRDRVRPKEGIALVFC